MGKVGSSTLVAPAITYAHFLFGFCFLIPAINCHKFRVSQKE